jgi:hypothetical protein
MKMHTFNKKQWQEHKNKIRDALDASYKSGRSYSAGTRIENENKILVAALWATAVTHGETSAAHLTVLDEDVDQVGYKIGVAAAGTWQIELYLKALLPD